MDCVEPRRVGVLLGGDPTERERSLASGEAAIEALQGLGHHAVAIHVDRDLDLALRQERVDVALIAVHGRGADGPLQGLLESLGIPYTGSSLAAAALAGDRLKMKELLRLHNVATPAYYCHSRSAGAATAQHAAFGFPCVVRPRSGAPSRDPAGALIAHDVDELDSAIEAALRFDDDVLVERNVAGRLIQVVVFDGTVLGAAELMPDPCASDPASWRKTGRALLVTPPRLGPERMRGVLTQAVRAHHLLGCDGATRVDLVVSERGNENLVAVDPSPALGEGSLVQRLALAAGISRPELFQRLLDGARLHAGRRMRERRSGVDTVAGRERRASATLAPH